LDIGWKVAEAVGKEVDVIGTVSVALWAGEDFLVLKPD